MSIKMEKYYNTYEVDGERLWSSIMMMAELGKTKQGGCNRLALSDIDVKARGLFIGWCREVGCTIHTDKFGNIFARREGENHDAPAVCIGSHLDTQETGGKFDGIYGVLSGLEVFRVLHENNLKTKVPIELAVWTNEEGARFQPAMQGSGLFTGILDFEREIERKDKNGISVKNELERHGYLEFGEPVGQRKISSYLELHIEQGPVLESKQNQIGIVRKAQGISWFDVHITGIESHAGTTPMEHRQDALVCAAELTLEVQKLAEEFEGALTTVGCLDVPFSSINTVPGNVSLTVDLRNPSMDELTQMETKLINLCELLSLKHRIDVQCSKKWLSEPINFELSDLVEQAVSGYGYTHQDIYSGAGHDACNLAQAVPTGMIFIPSVNGISHNPIEYSKPLDCTAGANVLLSSVLASCELITHYNQQTEHSLNA
ncbi:Zn-dependent hydrolase [Vibrio astriarenae]